MKKETQQQILLKQLQEGSVNSYYATFTLGIKQAPTRIKELREQGYSIVSTHNKDRSVDWHLMGSPKPVVKEVKQTSSFNEDDYVLVGNTFKLKADVEPRQMEAFV